MSVNDQVGTFLAITGSTDSEIARRFLEMSNQNLDSAISLFFEHGPSLIPSLDTPVPNAQSSNSDTASVLGDDIAYAESLQQQAYSQQQINTEHRAPIQPVHERLVDNAFPGFPPDPFGAFGAFGAFGGNAGNINNMFGGGRSDIFKQHDDNQYNEQNYSDSADDDDDRIVEVDSDGEPIEDSQSAPQNLDRLFRPPLDIIEKFDLDTAKVKARKFKKWILINIQDDADFQCQVLNRDFWSSLTIKGLVRREFVFLQYHKDSRSGGQYSQFYEVNGYPHIAILDPITGERVKTWTGVPVIKSWYREVEDFLSKYSLEKGSVNPVVQDGKKEIDPTTLTEEQQLEYAIQQSVSKNESVVDLSHTGNIDDPIEIEDSIEIDDLDSDDLDSVVEELSEEDQVKAIEAIEVPEPEANNPSVTRIQIRTADGKRVVRKFSIEDKVLVIYQFIKATFEKAKEGVFFTLTSQRENLFLKVNDNIGEAGLRNASILLEFVEDDEETHE